MPRNNSTSDPAYHVIKGDSVTLDADIPTCKAVLASAAQAFNYTDEAGFAHTGFPLQQGYNPIRVKQINSGTLTPENLWLLY